MSGIKYIIKVVGNPDKYVHMINNSIMLLNLKDNPLTKSTFYNNEVNWILSNFEIGNFIIVEVYK